jgi:hypothetical protein
LVDADARGRQRVALLVATVVLCGTAASAAFHYVHAAYLGQGYPLSTFLFRPHDRFKDFYQVYVNAQRFGSGHLDDLVYSPLLHIFTKSLTVAPATIGLVLVAVVFLAALAALLWRWFSPQAGQDGLVRLMTTVILGALAYPVLFVVDRGNLEMVVFVLLAVFFYLYFERRSRWAWLPLALAIAAKYYWATLLVLLLCDRHYRQAIWAFAGAVVATVLSIVAVALVSGYSIPHVVRITLTTLNGHVTGSQNLFVVQHGHSLWGLAMLIDRWTGSALWLMGVQNVRRLYILVVAALFLIACRLLLTRSYAGWEQATVLVICAILLPLENHDYTLIHLFLPLTLFVMAAGTGSRRWVCATLFAVPLIPVDYVYFSFQGALYDVSVSTVVYPVALVTLAVTVLAGGAKRGGAAEVAAGGTPAAQEEPPPDSGTGAP